MDTRTTEAGPITRRIARRLEAERIAVGRPAVWAPIPEWTRRAMARELPAKEYAR